MTPIHKQRFAELAEQLERLISSKTPTYDALTETTRVEIASSGLLEWKVKAKNLLGKACGQDSEHYNEFINNEATDPYATYLATLERLRAVFFAAKEDYEGGYLQSTRSLVQAEVFDTELDQATELLASGYRAAAAVIAGVVLETSLRELCDRNRIGHAKLDKMNADLAKEGVYNKLQQKRVTALADIRNSAAHGKPEEFTDLDVEDMIRDITRLVAEYL